jgi:phenylpropionate dioxygenase-like ring-hydroxylating dioxygenase large terminal subunit
MLDTQLDPQLDTLVMPAGGSDPNRFDVTEAWYPVFYLQDLDRAQPSSFTLLGRDLVLWWEAKTQTWRAFDDQCPHRLAPLSQGRINADGHLECPYHGWAFSGTGACEAIPQEPAGGQAKISQRACAISLPTAERQGLLFVYAGNPDHAVRVPIPVIEPMDESPEGWTLMDTFRDLPYDALTLLENVLDPSHIPYTHHNTVGKRSNASTVELSVTSSGKQGFTGTWPEGPRKGTLGQQDTFFIAPCLMWHELTSKQFGRTLTVVYATPIRKGECRLFARFPFKFSSKIPALAIGLTPRWYSHTSQNRILEDDQIFLHYQERYLADKGGSEDFNKAFYLPTKADKFVFEYRQWVNQYQADPFPGEPFPPRLSPEALMDRYSSHTQYCSSCRAALKRIQQIIRVSLVGMILCLAVSPLLALANQTFFVWLTAILALGLGTLTLGLNQFATRFKQGDTTPPRNLPTQNP